MSDSQIEQRFSPVESTEWRALATPYVNGFHCVRIATSEQNAETISLSLLPSPVSTSSRNFIPAGRTFWSGMCESSHLLCLVPHRTRRDATRRLCPAHLCSPHLCIALATRAQPHPATARATCAQRGACVYPLAVSRSYR